MFGQKLGRLAPRDRGAISGFDVIARSDLSAVAPRATASAEARRAKVEGGSDEAIHSSLAAPWIASRSLSSGARSRDPLARNDGRASELAV
jgi:hypothetical protein